MTSFENENSDSNTPKWALPPEPLRSGTPVTPKKRNASPEKNSKNEKTKTKPFIFTAPLKTPAQPMDEDTIMQETTPSAPSTAAPCPAAPCPAAPMAALTQKEEKWMSEISDKSTLSEIGTVLLDMPLNDISQPIFC